jgi:hypothetical protein
MKFTECRSQGFWRPRNCETIVSQTLAYIYVKQLVTKHLRVAGLPKP